MSHDRKKALQAELLAALQETLASLEAAHASAMQGATHAEAKPENDKDTRGLEQSYLARGQAKRIEGLKQGIAAVAGMPLSPLKKVQLGAIVEAEDEDGGTLRYFVAPDGGGTKLAGGVQVVTPNSPLGEALSQKGADDEVELQHGGRTRFLSILRVS